MVNAKTAGPVTDDVYVSVSRFLSLESSLLDRRAYLEWSKLWTDDIVYRVDAQVSQGADAGRKDYAIIDDDAAALLARIEQIATPRLTHAENPPSLARRFISGLRVERGAREDEVTATANMMVFRSRPDLPEGGLYVGERVDLLRQIKGGWRLARRSVRLDHAVLYGAVSVIF